MSYSHHHTDSGSDLDLDEEESLVRNGSVNHTGGRGRPHAAVNGNSFASSTYAAAAARLEKLPLCCCRLTPFAAIVLLLLALGFALLIPGVLMRLESIESPTPLILLNLCRQPSSWATSQLEAFRNEISRKGDTEADELRYEGLRLSTSALSVYRGTEKYQCAQEDAYESVQWNMESMRRVCLS